MQPLAYGLLLATLAVTLTPDAHAQDAGVVMAAYGGGNGDTWRESVGTPFQKATNTRVRIIDLPNTETAVRTSVQSPQYNVAWVGYFQAAQLYKDGMLETFDPKDFPEIAKVKDKFVLKSKDGKLIGIPVQFQYYGIAFNTEQAKASDFKTWSALGDPKWKGKLAQGQAFIAASYDLIMMSKIAGANEANVDPAIPSFTRFTKNAMTIMTSFAQGNTLLTRGEIAATPFYSARIRSLKKEKAPVDIVIPDDGGMALPYMLVMPKGAKDREATIAFMKFAMQADTQLRMYDYAGYIPFNTNARLSDAQLKELGMPLEQLMDKLYTPDFTLLADNMPKHVKLVEQIQAAK